MNTINHHNKHPVKAMHEQIPSQFILYVSPGFERFLIYPELGALIGVRDVEQVSD